MAPLMASLVGIDFPVNSVGVLPDVGWGKDGGYLDASEERRSQAALVNAKVTTVLGCKAWSDYLPAGDIGAVSKERR